MKTDEDHKREEAEKQRQYAEMKAEFPGLITRGFSCNIGWFPILREFFSTVRDILGDKSDLFVLLQVKEKFGGIRIYYGFDLDRVVPKEKQDRIHAACRHAEDRAYVTCDVCGKPGVLRKRGFWFMTRCDEHADGGIPVRQEV